PGTVEIVVTVQGVEIDDTAQIEFTSAPNGTESTVEAETPVRADGIEASTLTITVLDGNENPITDLVEGDFVFDEDALGNAEIDGFDATNAAAGVYTFQVTNVIPEIVEIVVTVRDVEIDDTEEIEF